MSKVQVHIPVDTYNVQFIAEVLKSSVGPWLEGPRRRLRAESDDAPSSDDPVPVLVPRWDPQLPLFSVIGSPCSSVYQRLSHTVSALFTDS